MDRCARRQPIIDRHHGQATAAGEGRIERIVHGRIANHPAAAMDIEHDAGHRPTRADDTNLHLHSLQPHHARLDLQAGAAQLAVGAELRQAQQTLNKRRHQAIARTKTWRARELSIEAFRFVQCLVVQHHWHAGPSVQW
jgi:hypothetical protein